MNKPGLLVEILKHCFRNRDEPLAVEFRKQIAETDNSHLIGPLEDEPSLEDWIDGQDVMQILHISSRTLQTLRSNGTLPYSRIGAKLYYRKQDILKILNDNYIMRKIRGYDRDK